jgi:hypothetical protein
LCQEDHLATVVDYRIWARICAVMGG